MRAPDALHALKLRLVLGASLIVLSAAPLAAQTTPPVGKLSEVERQAEAERERAAKAEREAEAVRKEVERLRGELIGAARQVQTGEAALVRLEKRKREIDELAGERTRALNARRGQLAGLLGALERLANRPPEALLAQPGAPDDTVRAGLLLRSIIPRIEAAAAQLRTEIEDLAQARDLRELIEKLDADRKQREEVAKRSRSAAAAKLSIPPPPPGHLAMTFTAAKGKLPLPARGTIAKRFNESETGPFARGIVVETRQRAAVVAPHDGQVVYAGEFRGYGLVLILEHGEGYHFLLAGLSRIDCAAGQWVLAGEPVGVMGSAGAESQRLYIELRRQGHPMDPLSWLVPDKDKVG
ncbi:MAG: hypothetical protein K0S54_3119 [Alphaproteobacteria bacterium]|nr:hypothetical protein [Alphaproteobacteria bacterium]